VGTVELKRLVDPNKIDTNTISGIWDILLAILVSDA